MFQTSYGYYKTDLLNQSYTHTQKLCCCLYISATHWRNDLPDDIVLTFAFPSTLFVLYYVLLYNCSVVLCFCICFVIVLQLTTAMECQYWSLVNN